MASVQRGESQSGRGRNQTLQSAGSDLINIDGKDRWCYAARLQGYHAAIFTPYRQQGGEPRILWKSYRLAKKSGLSKTEALLRENAMQLEKSIDDLVEAGWMVVQSDFDESAFENWRNKAAVCLDSLLGSEHAYTQYFRDHVRHSAESSLLTGLGILTAARMDSLNTP